MRKFSIIILSLALILSGCQNKDKTIGATMNEIKSQYDLYIYLNSLFVFRTDNDYLVVVEENGVVQKKVEFSIDRNYKNVFGLTLLKNEDVSQYINMSLNEVVAKSGEFHADVGSGFYIPAYITEDGYLVCFEMEDNIVYEVVKRDLLTNQVETISQSGDGSVIDTNSDN